MVSHVVQDPVGISIKQRSTWLQQLEDGFAVGGVDVPARPGLTAVGLGLVRLLMIIFRPRGLTGPRKVNSLSAWRLPSGWRRRPRPSEPAGGRADGAVDGDGGLVAVDEAERSRE